MAVTYEDLESYDVRVERDFGVSGLARDTDFPPGEDRRCPSSPSDHGEFPGSVVARDPVYRPVP